MNHTIGIDPRQFDKRVPKVSKQLFAAKVYLQNFDMTISNKK